MNKVIITTLLFVCMQATCAWADDYPSINPTGTFYGSEGEETGTSYSGSAPLEAHFAANPEDVGDWTPYYEWRFTLEGEETPYLIRYEEETDVTFTKAGAHRIVCYAQFTLGNDTISFTQEYWDETGPMTVTISESHIDFPNAFSPNGDGINDYYQAKGTQSGNGPQSIVSFEGHIYNRWGQELYSWTDCNNYQAGWDGTFNGNPVKQGVYFLLAKAKGADGIVYKFKKDINLLRGYNEDRGLNQ